MKNNGEYDIVYDIWATITMASIIYILDHSSFVITYKLVFIIQNIY